MSETTIKLDTKGLDHLIKALKEPLPVIHVGILTKNARGGQANGAGNASIGAAHEFGTSKLPMRSFLRVPLSENLSKKLESANAFSEDVLKNVIKQATLVPWLKKIAVLAEAIVIEAFATKGFGKWPAWKNPNYKNKGNTLLVDTGQLRDSITSEVK